ncbi:MAG: carbohydrate ABC transporter permease [Candidatus Sumerlaeia bacterium]|nr:carbohydrate ABC transporter permease [Candidatus Sumerlaeia bacterium]
MNIQKKTKRIIIHLLLIAGSLVFMVPFLWTVATSLKTDAQIQDISSLGRILIPNPVAFKNYLKVLTYIDYPRYFLNSLTVTLMCILGSIISCTMVAYSFARLKWPGRNICFLVMLSTMMLPPQVTMIPVFLIYKHLGLVNTLKALFVPSFFGTAFFIFMLRQFFLTIPKDLEEAAKIDGSGYGRIFLSIMLPLIKPALLGVIVFQFMWAWNDFVNPLIYIHEKEKMTLTIGLQAFNLVHGAEWSLVMAASVMMTIPVIILFFFAQRYFIEGITLTGIKG